MHDTTTVPAHPPAKSSPTAKSDAPSKTHCLMSCNADWTEVEVLTLDELCARHIRRVLNRCGGNCTATAQLLGIGRTTLYRYLKREASHQFRG
jgi:transcriptional regulator of acetoin/glycerol metabolism